MNFDGLYASLILIAALIVLAGLGVAGVTLLVNALYKLGPGRRHVQPPTNPAHQ
jgi:hypothetical protein